ncbi:DUF397 domain-containing protein [Streptomyces sp. NPDC091265]|uniref:DUF397 domain-containing protein n=1 Tax=Streptomyces sp. NPDC091265 TaxID=3365977 RepID=UPI003817DD89
MDQAGSGSGVRCDLVPVRDSKAAPEGPALTFAAAHWAPFVAALRDGRLLRATPRGLRSVPASPGRWWGTGSPAASRSMP